MFPLSNSPLELSIFIIFIYKPSYEIMIIKFSFWWGGGDCVFTFLSKATYR